MSHQGIELAEMDEKQPPPSYFAGQAYTNPPQQQPYPGQPQQQFYPVQPQQPPYPGQPQQQFYPVQPQQPPYPGQPQQPPYPGQPQPQPYPGQPQQQVYPGQPQQQFYPGQPQEQPYPGQPQQQVVVVTDKTTGNPANSYLGFAIFTCICCCWPIGIAAIIYAVRTNDQNGRGQFDAAQNSSKTAFRCSLVALIIGSIMIVLFIFLQVTGSLTIRRTNYYG